MFMPKAQDFLNVGFPRADAELAWLGKRGSPASLTWLAYALVLLACFLGASPLSAQTPDGILLTNEIRNARARLQWERRGLPTVELDRLAEFVGRSNFLANAIANAFRNNNLTNAAELLARFPGKLDDVTDFGQPLLYRAAQGGNEAQLNFLLEHQVDPNRATQFGETPLTSAINSRHWWGALRLVHAGASVTTTNTQTWPVLAQLLNGWWSPVNADDGRAALLEAMLERGADPFVPWTRGNPQSILEQALNAHAGEVGDALLTNRASVTRLTPRGDTALHLAARWGMTNALEVLLQAGFPVDQTNADGLTPLQCIADSAEDPAGRQMPMFFNGIRHGRLTGPPPAPPGQVAGLLLDRGAKLDVFCAAGLERTNELAALLRENPALANARDGLGRTPLHYAAARNIQPNFKAVRGATTTSGPPTASTNLVSASFLLLSAGADPAAATTKPIPSLHRDQASPSGTTPLHLAALHGNEELVKALLAAKAPAAVPDQEGDTPLHVAARFWSTNCTARLLGAHVPFNLTNSAGRTPLRVAVDSRVSANVLLLLEVGARPELGLRGDTLMHLAAENDDIATLAVLQAHGLPIEGRDHTGATPFHRAAVARQREALEWLRSRGADVNATDLRRDTALHLLAAQRNDEVFHSVDQNRWDRWKQRSFARPGIVSRTLKLLVTAKILAPPAPPRWTNTSLSAWLIEKGARPDLTNNAGQTPLHILCGQPWANYDSPGVSNRLALLFRADPRLDRTDAKGRTPVQIALTNLAPSLVAELLPRVGNIDARQGPQGRTWLEEVVARVDPSNSQRSQEILRLLLKSHADPNVRDNDGATALHLAMSQAAGNLNYPLCEVVSLLLKNGANPNLADHEGRTSLHVLAANTDANTHPGDRLGAVLLDGRWNFAARDHVGQTPVHLWAATLNTGCGTCAQFFRSVLTNAGLVNLTNSEGDTALHLAGRARREWTFPILVEAGANASLRNRRGETGFRFAALNNWTYPDTNRNRPLTSHRFFEALLSRDEPGFGHWLDADPTLCNLTNQNGVTPLMIATEQNLKSVTERLIASGTTMDLLSAMRLDRWENFERQLAATKGAVSPDWVFEAVARHKARAVEDFAAAGADLQARDGDGHSLVFRASTSDQTELADWLRAQGCEETIFDAISRKDMPAVAAFLARDPMSLMWTNRNGTTPVLAAAIAGSSDLVSLLLDHGAKTSERTSGGWSLLHISAARDSLALGRRLIAAGLDPNELALGGLGPLHLAAAYGHTEFANMLMDHGANPSLSPPEDPRWSGNTPLHWAATKGHIATVRLLLARGANPNLPNRSGQTPAMNLKSLPLRTSWGFLTPSGINPPFSAVYSETIRQEILALLEGAPSTLDR